MTVSRDTLLSLMRAERHVVQSSVHATGTPQSAIVGVAVSDDFDIVFDTVETTRKAGNLRARPHVAFVFGGNGVHAEETVQVEAEAHEPVGVERERMVALYLSVFPDGVARQQWPGLTYFRAATTWLRYSDFRVDPPDIVEFSDKQLLTLT